MAVGIGAARPGSGAHGATTEKEEEVERGLSRGCHGTARLSSQRSMKIVSTARRAIGPAYLENPRSQVLGQSTENKDAAFRMDQFDPRAAERKAIDIYTQVGK